MQLNNICTGSFSSQDYHLAQNKQHTHWQDVFSSSSRGYIHTHTIFCSLVNVYNFAVDSPLKNNADDQQVVYMFNAKIKKKPH